MAVPISQHTIESFTTYTIVYGENNEKVEIPFDPKYLVPMLKNDIRLISSYEYQPISPIEQYEYAHIGDLKFTLSVSVKNELISISSFINDVLFMMYDKTDHENIEKLLSISACSKALMLSTLYILYYSLDDTDIRTEFLNKVNTLQPIDLYQIVVDKMEDLCFSSEGIDVARFIPTIEVEELTSAFDKTLSYNDAKYIDINTNVMEYKNLSNNVVSEATIEEVYSNGTTEVMQINTSLSDMLQKEVSIGSIYGFSNIAGTSKKEVQLKPLRFPTSIFTFSESKAILTNLTKYTEIILPAGTTFEIEEAGGYYPQPYVLTEAITIYPGRSVKIYDLPDKRYIKLVAPANSDDIVIQCNETRGWLDELYFDKNNGSLSFVYENNQTVKTDEYVKYITLDKPRNINVITCRSTGEIENKSSNLRLKIQAGFSYNVKIKDSTTGLSGAMSTMQNIYAKDGTIPSTNSNILSSTNSNERNTTVSVSNANEQYVNHSFSNDTSVIIEPGETYKLDPYTSKPYEIEIVSGSIVYILPKLEYISSDSDELENFEGETVSGTFIVDVNSSSVEFDTNLVYSNGTARARLSIDNSGAVVPNGDITNILKRSGNSKGASFSLTQTSPITNGIIQPKEISVTRDGYSFTASGYPKVVCENSSTELNGAFAYVDGNYSLNISDSMSQSELKQLAISSLLSNRKYSSSKYQQDVIYHINKVAIIPNYTIYFSPDKTLATKFVQAMKPIPRQDGKMPEYEEYNGPIDPSDTSIRYSILTEAATSARYASIADIANKFLSHTSVYLSSANGGYISKSISNNIISSSTLSGSLNLGSGNRIIVDISDAGIYYYNGNIYQNK